MTFDALIFDFFGVVCNEIGSPWLREHHLQGKDLEERVERPADLGIQSQEEHFKELSELSGMPATDIEREWEGRARFDADLVALIKGWRGQYKTGLLSNAPSPFFHTLLARSGVAPYLDAVVVSSEIGYVKPEPEMYRAILEELAVAPEHALMIDDREKNLEGARAVGMRGHLYVSAEELRRYLASA